jgi:hypothetical protein
MAPPLRVFFDSCALLIGSLYCLSAGAEESGIAAKPAR